ncbi:MAG: hypothetical protein ABI646_03910 [Acidobacteriota bacterium]
MIRKKIISILVLSVCVVAGASGVLAQGRYVNVYSRGDVDNFIRNLETSSDTFSRDFKNTGGTSSSERRNVDRFENAVDRLRNRFNSNNTWWASRNEVQNMMGEARQVNVMMNNDRFGRPLERQWRDLRRDINKLADTYDLPDLGGQLDGGGGGTYPPIGGGGGQTSRPPAWAQGTFYATSGPNIMMTIESNGQISLNNNGQTYYGRYNRGQMFLNNDVSTVSRSGNGISTYNTTTGQTTQYSRDTYGGGGGEDGPSSRPANWAVGTFYATNGSNIQMSISSDGRVVVINSGSSYTGRYYNGQIYLNNDVSTVSRIGRNGIRTYNQSAGITTDYRRQ